MITLKQLTWSNIFSYGANNTISLDTEPLTQLVGKNGSGKTSIPLILQEVLYGKNTKNIKKQDLQNRHLPNQGYEISLSFSKDNDDYLIVLNRKNTIKLVLYKNGEDISSHTSTNTYKQISSLLGVEDFKVFIQLIYQSSTGSLEFLTATDTNRKKFLISLLQLDKYIELFEIFKLKARDKALQVSNIEGKIETNQSWINKNKDQNVNELPMKEEPLDISKDIMDKMVAIKYDLSNIKKINSTIRDNNYTKMELDSLDTKIMFENIPQVDKEVYSNIIKTINNKEGLKLEPRNLLTKMKGLSNECPSCFQSITDEYVNTLITGATTTIESLDEEIKLLKEEKLKLDKAIAAHNKQADTIKKFEELNRSFDKSLPTVLVNVNDLEKELNDYNSKLDANKKEIEEVNKYNNMVRNHNSKVEIIKKQLKDFEEELQKFNNILSVEQEESDTLELLKKVFNTNGLVSYKIESSVKELEKTINLYLSNFSHFQIFFFLDKEKLNIKVIDNLGNETCIESLSAGELGRVNIATVLAIRKIMSQLTSTKLNFLFLDEIIGVLDSEGREKLTEILLGEGLNTFMVSHEYEHPLVPKLYIIKTNNISKIEMGG